MKMVERPKQISSGLREDELFYTLDPACRETGNVWNDVCKNDILGLSMVGRDECTDVAILPRSKQRRSFRAQTSILTVSFYTDARVHSGSES